MLSPALQEFLAMTDTIIAQATPPGESAIGIMRVSGKLCSEICKDACGQTRLAPRYAKLVSYKNIAGNKLDQVIVTFYEHGQSYTGEDSLEISYHGNPLIGEQIREDLLKRGCRAAQPGEFTKLAFLNGKIDLSQAESVAQIISAKNQQSLAAAQRNLKGELSKRILNIQDKILELQASIEAFIDFPEEELGEYNKSSQINSTQIIIDEIQNILKQASKTKLLQKNIRIALVGLPNAGKSSLFNEIIGHKRALVHELAGTTRDYIEMEIKVGNHLITLVDTAGIHKTRNEIENEGVNLTYEQIENADIVIWVLDGSAPYPSEFGCELKRNIAERPVILVVNKIDIGDDIILPIDSEMKVQKVSCVTSEGIDVLIKALNKVVISLSTQENDEGLFVGQRHEHLLSNCLVEIHHFQRNLKDELGHELLSDHLTNARKFLDEMVGMKTNENMLDKLFGEFCIGK